MFPERQFCKKTACSSYVQPWLVAIGDWRLAVGGDWRLAVGDWRLVVVGGGWWLVIGGWWRLAVVGGWWLVAAGGWWLAVGGPLAWSSRRVLNKKNLVPKGPPCFMHFRQ